MIKGILFDKDGTLVDFFSMWLSVAVSTVSTFMKEYKLGTSQEMSGYILEAMGVIDGHVDPKGGLAYKSYAEIAEDVCLALQEKHIFLNVKSVKNSLEAIFQEYITASNLEYRELADVKSIMAELQERGYHIGLATADTVESAKYCLERLGITEYFEYIGADDGIKAPKPAPDMYYEFAKQCEIEPEEIAVVGDTLNDIRFAKQNGGVAIGVLSGVSALDDFNENADYLLQSIGELRDMLNRNKER